MLVFLLWKAFVGFSKSFLVFSKGDIALGQVSGRSLSEMLPKCEISQDFSGALPTSLTTGSQISNAFKLSPSLPSLLLIASYPDLSYLVSSCLEFFYSVFCWVKCIYTLFQKAMNFERLTLWRQAMIQNTFKQRAALFTSGQFYYTMHQGWDFSSLYQNC